MTANAEFLELVGPTATAISLLLAVVSLLLTVKALRGARLQNEAARDHAKQLAELKGGLTSIGDSLSTRYLGQFPAYVSEIAQLLDKAERSISIFCDLPGYGVFSDRASWVKIQQATQLKIEDGVEFDVTFYSESQREKIIRDQMAQTPGGLQGALASDQFKRNLEVFMKHYGATDGGDEVTLDDYVKASLQAHQRIAEHVFASVDVKEVDGEMPLYFWIIDDLEAIISIPIFIDQSTEYGFRTSDQSFIAALVDLKRKYLTSRDTR